MTIKWKLHRTIYSII